MKSTACVIMEWLYNSVLTIQVELHDGHERLPSGTHPQELYDVRVVKPLHYIGLTEEVNLARNV